MPTRPLLRRCLALALLGLCFALSGCVYLRLLAFKRQLADFDKNFTLQTDDGLRLTCREPVVLAEDFRWLGVTPESVKTLGHAQQWRIRWTKEIPPGVRERAPHDIDLEVIFTDGKFARLAMPESLFAFVPKPFFTGLLRSLGRAGVDKSKRLAEVNFTAAEREQVTARVTATSLALLFGVPTEQMTDGPRTVLRYRYTPMPPQSKNGVIDMTFIFDTATGQLRQLTGRSLVGQVAFNFEAPATPSP